jgi:hypothetical protein
MQSPEALPSADPVFRVFSLFCECVLNAERETALAYRVYQYLRQPGAFVVQFYPDPNVAPFEVGYLPSAQSDDAAVTALHTAMTCPEAHDFAHVPDPIDQLEHVTALYYALREQDPALVEFRLPLSDFHSGLAAMEEFFQELDLKERSEESDDSASVFELLALLLLDDEANLHWTLEREALCERRIEVLEYAGEPGSLVLVHFEPEECEVQLCAYLPTRTHVRESPGFLQELRAYASARQLATTPRPRALTSAFTPLDYPLAAKRCAQALAALGEGQGIAHDFVSIELFAQVSRPVREHLTPDHLYSTRLH